MEAVLMQRAAAVRSRCVGQAASLAGRGQRPGVVRLGVARRAGAVRARLGPARAHVSEERRTEVVGDAEAVRLFVGLPEDLVSPDGRAVCRPRAIAAALRALKLLGVDGVELPVSWTVAQPGPGDEFEWAGYRTVAGMVRDAGLKLSVSLCTDGAALPDWVADAADPDILVTDRAGNRREGCLSFAVDELPVLAGGKSPVEAYEDFFSSFGDAFADFMGSTVTDVTVSLGPSGELRYPSYPPGSAGDYAGAGEFQCYDKHALAKLKRHAESRGQPLWGLSGPHDGPRYDEAPDLCAFFRENGGSWKTPYGDFFLSWYAGELLAHGDRILAAASRALGSRPVQLSAKVPLLPHRASRATAGFHGDGYGPVADLFARHACTVIASGVDARRDTEELLARMKDACAEHGALFAVESAPLAVADGSTGVWGALLSAERTRPRQFTYQRMGAEFFGPSHWPLFVQFVRTLESPDEAHQDDLPAADDDGEQLTVPASSGREAQSEAREMQTV